MAKDLTRATRRAAQVCAESAGSAPAIAFLDMFNRFQIPTALLELIINHCGADFLIAPASYSIQLVSKSWHGACKSVTASLKELDTGELAFLQSSEYRNDEARLLNRHLGRVLALCPRLEILTVDANDMKFFSEADEWDPSVEISPADCDGMLAKLVSGVFGSACKQLQTITVKGRASTEAIMDVATHCPLLQTLSWQSEWCRWADWRLDDACIIAMQALKSNCPNIEKLPPLAITTFTGPGPVAGANLTTGTFDEPEQLLNGMAVFFDLLSTWPSLQRVDVTMSLFNQPPQAIANIHGAFVQHAKLLEADPGSFTGKLLLTLKAKSYDFDFGDEPGPMTENLGTDRLVLVDGTVVHLVAINQCYIYELNRLDRKTGEGDEQMSRQYTNGRWSVPEFWF